jgi:hypothetical protein
MSATDKINRGLYQKEITDVLVIGNFINIEIITFYATIFATIIFLFLGFMFSLPKYKFKDDGTINIIDQERKDKSKDFLMIYQT